MSTPKQTLTEFSSLLQAMTRVLDEERQALESRDATALSTTTIQKNEICADLAHPRFGEALHTGMADLPADERAECERDHIEALSKLEKIKDSNLVNGKILNRSQNSVREILHLLSGRSPNGLYGESGQPQSGSETGRDSIARV